MSRMSPDGWVALALIALCGLFLNELLTSEASGAFVKTTTLPTALVFVLIGLSVLLLVGALRDGAPASAHRPKNIAGHVRICAMVGWIALYVASLPLAGYIFASVVFLIGSSLLYGNRRLGVIVIGSILLPVILQIFFEKVMIVLLPASRLLG